MECKTQKRAIKIAEQRSGNRYKLKTQSQHNRHEKQNSTLQIFSGHESTKRAPKQPRLTEAHKGASDAARFQAGIGHGTAGDEEAGGSPKHLGSASTIMFNLRGFLQSPSIELVVSVSATLKRGD